jgi:proline iminopeptidase
MRMIVLAWILGGLMLCLALAVGVLYLASPAVGTVPETTATDSTLPVVELDGYRFHAEAYGEEHEPTVIVLHGGPGADYRALLPLVALAGEFRMVFYDQRGSGLSPRVSADELTLERFLDDLDHFVEHFSPNRPVYLIGHSWGAMLATAYVGRHPYKVDKLVLAEPAFLDQEHMEIYNRKTGLIGTKPSARLMWSMIGPWAESLHIRGPDKHARKDYLTRRFFAAPVGRHPLAGYYREGKVENAAAESWRFGALVIRAVAANGIDREGRIVDLAAGVEAWQGTALFIAGSEDAIIGPDHQKDQMKRFPRARLVVIQGAGHTMIGEKPEDTLAAVRTYFAET